jgi:glyoxylase-like metal-dependent hydrolase (beta-lactamase superfamily II)
MPCSLDEGILKQDELPDGLHLLDLPQPMDGFRYFISSWFFIAPDGRRIVVDPGPARSIDALLDKLSAITDGVDLVLLTHIHLDHSGGVGQFCKKYRNAKVLAHPRAKRHLLSPEKLWTASLKTIGKVAELYGEPAPLAPDALLDGCETEGITTIETPGHTPHHVSFIAPFGGRRLFFAGEAAGLYLPLASSGTPYLRPTTPPKFDAPGAKSSLRKIAQAITGDELLCYSHWGASSRAGEMISLAEKQLDDWASIIYKEKDQPEEALAERLLSDDPLLAGFSRLPEDIQARERIFIKNSVKGFILYFQEDQSPA